MEGPRPCWGNMDWAGPKES
ncbi:hypothetical protein CCACVL1_09018 [Corchorus capsularis]|uniref:Uncharacterized protein n=1 Tax=Corchorus capsularis TaxID=210143 RepID=A0A1R3IY30_COCAP|nr:hypothetical protein CCACVL1_09018 [Corchorus capsularis]